jgi:glycosyltransferase involved in cell wall biosynthesis
LKLSILIPTLPERYGVLKRLQGILTPQIEKVSDQVCIHYHDAGKSMTTGEKRNHLISACQSDYFCFIDDDDIIPAYYVDEILKAIEQSPDVVTFIGHMTTNGANRKNFTIKLHEKYEERGGHFYRFPNHLCTFKRSLVQHVKFPHVHIMEDYHWAKRINDMQILKTEVHINKEMYHYDYRSKK